MCTSSYYLRQIGNIKLFHCCHVFSRRLCVWDGSAIVFCPLLHIHLRKAGCLFLLVCSLLCANNLVHFVLNIAYVCLRITLFHYHPSELSKGIHLIRRLSGIYCRMFSEISFMQYMEQNVFYHYSFDIARMCALLIIVIKTEILIISHCLGLGLETIICTICLCYVVVLLWIKTCTQIINLAIIST